MASDQNLTKKSAPRALWSGKMGFVLAAAASALGLGCYVAAADIEVSDLETPAGEPPRPWLCS